MHKVTVGIATLNGVSRLDLLLASIRASAPAVDYRVLVIDDGSHERNLLVLRELCKAHEVELQEHRQNYGISTTWNHLAARYESELVVLLNDDVIVKPGWLESIVYFLDKNPKVGTVGLHPIRDGKIIVCGGGMLDLNAPEAGIPHRVVAANGYAFGFHRSLWLYVGKFDELYQSFYEEVDFSARLWEAGCQSFNIPWPVIDHEWSSTFQQNDAQLLPRVRMEMSKKRFIEKWGGDVPEVVTRLKATASPPARLRWLAENKTETSGDRVFEVLR